MSVSASGGKAALLTRYRTDAVRWPSISRGGSFVVFVRGGELYTVAPTGGEPRKVPVLARSDDKENNTARLNLTAGASEVEVAPDGKTLALVIRGDIWTLPAAGGDAKRLVSSPGNDYDIWWSPDGSIASCVGRSSISPPRRARCSRRSTTAAARSTPPSERCLSVRSPPP